MKNRNSQKGFTLIELVMVIVILAILGVIAIPKYVDLQTEAKNAAEEGVVGGVRAGLATYFIDVDRGNRLTYPATLDGVAVNTDCVSASPCFTTVLQQGGLSGVTQAKGGWKKVTATTYLGPTGSTYTYTPGNGEFKKT